MGIGADLRQAREELGISLQTIADKTKINIPFLEAIEREDWSVFPSHTFAKGFLRAYAKMVKVDTVLATRQFNEEVSPSSVTVAPAYNIEQGPLHSAVKPQAAPKRPEPAPVPPPPVKKETTAPAPARPEPVVQAPVPSVAPPPESGAKPEIAPKPEPAPKSVTAPKAPSKSKSASTKTAAKATPKAVVPPPPSAPPATFDERAAREEHEAVARMLFTGTGAPPVDPNRWMVTALKLFLALLVLLFLGLAGRGVVRWVKGWGQGSSSNVEDQFAAVPTEAPAPMQAVTTSAPAVERKVPPPAPKRPTPAKPKPVAAAPAAPTATVAVGTAPTTVKAVPPALAAAPPTPTTAQAAAQAAAPVERYHRLVLKGLESAWVLVVVDGKTRSEFNLLPGQTRAFQAAKGFALKIGNAAGVEAQYDGRSLGVLGGRGSVVEFALPQGYQSVP